MASDFRPLLAYPADRSPDQAGDNGMSLRGAEIELLKGQFLASLNHELRTPLSGVIGMTDLLLETTLDSEQRDYVATLKECATQLLETLNTVLDYSALSAGNLRTEEAEFRLEELLGSVLADVHSRASGKGIEVHVRVADDMPETLIGDERYLRQALLQLMRNAVKFTSKGSVELSVYREMAPDRPDRPAERGYFRFDVLDTGIGIPTERLKAIFESFRQLDTGLAKSYSGLGLGLAIVQKVLMFLHGEISVQSEPGKGSCFKIRVPLRLPAASSRSGLAVNGQVSAPRLLVVEDDAVARQVIWHVLNKGGYQAVIASSGIEALELCRAEKFDGILMDLQMPVMDGFTTSRAIRDLSGYHNVPIIAVTANLASEERSRCQDAGIQEVLSKPVRREEVFTSLQRHLPVAAG